MRVKAIRATARKCRPHSLAFAPARAPLPASEAGRVMRHTSARGTACSQVGRHGDLMCRTGPAPNPPLCLAHSRPPNIRRVCTRPNAGTCSRHASGSMEAYHAVLANNPTCPPSQRNSCIDGLHVACIAGLMCLVLTNVIIGIILSYFILFSEKATAVPTWLPRVRVR